MAGAYGGVWSRRTTKAAAPHRRQDKGLGRGQIAKKLFFEYNMGSAAMRGNLFCKGANQTMSKKGENIYKRKDGRWEGRYLKEIPGEKPKYGYIYAHSYREAREKLREAVAIWKTQPPTDQEESLCLRSVAQAWELQTFPQIKESSRVKYHTMLQRHILPKIGSIPLSELTHQKIEALSQELLRSLSPRSVSDIMAVLRGVLRFARVGGADVPCDGSTVRIRRPPVEIRVLTQSEQAILMRYIFDHLTLRNAGILLSLMTGLRVGEICALKWEDIALDEQMLYVRHTLHRLQSLSPEGPRTKIVETTPKTASSARAIPLPEDLVRVLLSLPGPREGYFLTGEINRCIEPRNMQYHFDRVIYHCGIEHANYHALRHTFATRCVELGFDVKSLSELLGHAAVGMTLDRYVHPTMELKRSHMQRLAPFLSGELTVKQNFPEM